MVNSRVVSLGDFIDATFPWSSLVVSSFEEFPGDLRAVDTAAVAHGSFVSTRTVAVKHMNGSLRKSNTGVS
jgi:hypothetical protein